MIVLGAMSGTSTDAIDVAALSCSTEAGAEVWSFLGMHSVAFAPELQARLLQLQAVPWAICSADPLMHMLHVRRDLTLAYASAVQALMQQLGLNPNDVAALGAHGQTLRHMPAHGITYQMLDPALLAAQTAVPVVADLRAADVALGGQGAPLVPGFHWLWLRQVALAQSTQKTPVASPLPSAGHAVAVLNLGGFANLTVLPSLTQNLDLHVGLGQVYGGDCGPANVWIDHWARQQFGCTMDTDGRIAAQGKVHLGLLQHLLQHPFFAQPWPKSTGRDDFTLAYFQQCLQATRAMQGDVADHDVMATLVALTAQTVAACVPSSVLRIYVCGGGVHNPVLLAALEQALQARAQPVQLLPFDDLGLPAQAVEACAFAWLAAQRLRLYAGNCTKVTGAKQAAVLGALYCGQVG